MLSKRLRKEIDSLSKNKDEFITLVNDPDNMLSWKAFIQGPPSSAYEGYEFELAITIGSDYPLTAPTMTFVTKIFHPNVYFTVCIIIIFIFIIIYAYLNYY